MDLPLFIIASNYSFSPRYSDRGDQPQYQDGYGAEQYRADQYGPTGADQYTYNERFITEQELYRQNDNDPRGGRGGPGGPGGVNPQTTSSVTDYFGRPINLNSSLQSSLMDEMSDEWETRSEVARL